MMDLQLCKYLYNTKHRTVTDPGISEPGSLANQRHLVCLILRLGLILLSYMIERSPDLTFAWSLLRSFCSNLRELIKGSDCLNINYESKNYVM